MPRLFLSLKILDNIVDIFAVIHYNRTTNMSAPTDASFYRRIIMSKAEEIKYDWGLEITYNNSYPEIIK